MLKLCEKENFIISSVYPTGTFVLEGSPFLVILNTEEISKECEDKIHLLTNIEHNEFIEDNYYYGFRQLKEVAVRALSPGINDPGTAILSLHALADLLAFRASHFPQTNIEDSAGRVRIIFNEKTFDEIFREYFLAVWDYGKNDRSIQHEVHLILLQLQSVTENKLIAELLQEVKSLQINDLK